MDRDGACGYVLAALDSAQFYEQCKKEWLPQVCTKYPVPTKRETIEEVHRLFNTIYIGIVLNIAKVT